MRVVLGDFITSKDRTAFHSDQEAARILVQAIEWARQGQLSLVERRAT